MGEKPYSVSPKQIGAGRSIQISNWLSAACPFRIKLSAQN